MNQDLYRNTTRRGESTALFGSESNVLTGSHYSQTSAPPLSAPTAVNPATQSSILDQYSSSNAWSRKSQETRMQGNLPSLTEPYVMSNADTTVYHTYPYERHSPTPSGDSYHGAPQQANASPDETSTGTWRGLHLNDRRTGPSNNTDTPLTLTIPQSQDLPGISTTSTTIPSEGHSQHYSNARSQTSLPSFASLREHSVRSEDVDGPEIAPMSSRLSCYLCTELRPLVKEVVDAVAELDESVRLQCNKSANPPLDIIPQDSPVRAVQWILDRLRGAKAELQHANRQNISGHAHQPPTAKVGEHHDHSTPNSLKRPGEGWDRDGLQLKRPRSGACNEPPFYLPPFTLTPRDDRRGSIDFAFREPRLGYSPPPTESLPGSAHPRHMSPTLSQRTPRALPSPSSLAYPLSAAPSIPPTAPSVGSPATSYQPASSTHTASTNSVTSAHMADLQHQVTLKSLALQTLQSEYASLLQKLQREKVKSQTIEKKTNVADQEVNDLTSRNEELSEQIKSLTSQVEELEKKRDGERADTQKEKDQWGRMLEMSGRLHLKVDNERQRLLGERDALAQRLRVYEGNLVQRAGQGLSSSSPDNISLEPVSKSKETAVTDGPYMVGAENSNPEETAFLRREIQQLKARVKALRFALEQTKLQTSDLEHKSRNFAEQCNSSSAAIAQALRNDDTLSTPASDQNRGQSGRSTPTRAKPGWESQPDSRPSNDPPPVSGQSRRSGKLDVVIGGKITTADMANVGRARSPGPEELGFEVQPLTSSPEELIRALGPLPKIAPMPPFSFSPSTHSWVDPSNHSKRISEVSRNYADYKTPRTSPQSHSSSPGRTVEDGVSRSGSSGGYASEPETVGRSDAQPLPSLSALPLLSVYSTTSHDNMPRFREHPYLAGSNMPPPPKPDVINAIHRQQA